MKSDEKNLDLYSVTMSDNVSIWIEYIWVGCKKSVKWISYVYVFNACVYWLKVQNSNDHVTKLVETKYVCFTLILKTDNTLTLL